MFIQGSAGRAVKSTQRRSTLPWQVVKDLQHLELMRDPAYVTALQDTKATPKAKAFAGPKYFLARQLEDEAKKKRKLDEEVMTQEKSKADKAALQVEAKRARENAHLVSPDDIFGRSIYGGKVFCFEKFRQQVMSLIINHYIILWVYIYI